MAKVILVTFRWKIQRIHKIRRKWLKLSIIKCFLLQKFSIFSPRITEQTASGKVSAKALSISIKHIHLVRQHGTIYLRWPLAASPCTCPWSAAGAVSSGALKNQIIYYQSYAFLYSPVLEVHGMSLMSCYVALKAAWRFTEGGWYCNQTRGDTHTEQWSY